LTSLFIALHTADPGEDGTQATSEVSYTGYARVAVARTAGGWTVSAGSVSPTANIEFWRDDRRYRRHGRFYASIGVAASGASKILYRGALSPSIAYAVGVIPRIKTSSTITED